MKGKKMIDDDIMYSEVYEILTILGPKYINKIPSPIYEYIKSKKRINYCCNINNCEHVENQNLMKETIEFISYINLKYWADEKERKNLISVYNKNEEIFSKKYDFNNIFNNKKIEKKELAVVEVKNEKWYEKILFFIENLLKKNKK